MSVCFRDNENFDDCQMGLTAILKLFVLWWNSLASCATPMC